MEMDTSDHSFGNGRDHLPELLRLGLGFDSSRLAAAALAAKVGRQRTGRADEFVLLADAQLRPQRGHRFIASRIAGVIASTKQFAIPLPRVVMNPGKQCLNFSTDQPAAAAQASHDPPCARFCTASKAPRGNPAAFLSAMSVLSVMAIAQPGSRSRLKRGWK